MPFPKTDSDWQLIEKIREGDSSSFETLYTKYAAMMFGCILDICKDPHLSSRIFKSVFLNLKESRVSDISGGSFPFWLWQYTGSETIRVINESRVDGEVKNKSKAIIDFLCFNKVNRDEAAVVFNTTSNEIGLLIKKDLQFLN